MRIGTPNDIRSTPILFPLGLRLSTLLTSALVNSGLDALSLVVDVASGMFCLLARLSLFGGGGGVCDTAGMAAALGDGSGGGEEGYSDAKVRGIGLELLKLRRWFLARLCGREEGVRGVVDVEGGMRASSEEREERRVEKNVLPCDVGV